MLIIFTGEKDEKKINQQTKLVCGKKKKNEKAGGKQSLNVDELTSFLVLCTKGNKTKRKTPEYLTFY